ncbi:hypothetical protein [Polyangium mundeleinium]|uniref:Uncharacterized protein n=1 Tax=Polyangium mundeleinium TaxID=2995306 RepID=A0ABT5EY10_9BACT|nr:hypothetical protein [Polyangium mundeleinium]MDC0746167.1 hypothetical protein [Polyangium mundeleinium]
MHDLTGLLRNGIGVGIPVLVGVAFALASFRESKRVQRENERRAKVGNEVRVPGDLSPGFARLRVRVIDAGSAARVNLGTSVESAEDLSGAPELETVDVLLADDSGRTFRLPAGHRLKVYAFGGARRHLTESVTTEDGGVHQRFSFEVGPAQSFVLACKLPEASAGNHPFRQADDAAVLLPVGDRFEINPPPEKAQTSDVGCIVVPCLVVGVVAATVPEHTGWRVAGWVVWLMCVLLGLVGRSVANDTLPKA